MVILELFGLSPVISTYYLKRIKGKNSTVINKNIQIPNYQGAKVLVVGDVMLDIFWQGRAERISPEAPVPVLRYQQKTQRAGGAANVAINAAALGAQVTLIGVVGKDEQGAYLADILQQHGVKFLPLFCEDKPTISKIRMMSQHQQLLRVDHEILPMYSPNLLALFKKVLPQFQYVIASDYAKGALFDIQSMIAAVHAAGSKILIDPKGHDFQKYQGAYLITPNMAEFSAVFGQAHDEKTLQQKAKTAIKQLSLTHLLLTRSEAGMSIFSKQDQHVSHVHHQARAKEVFDVTGAGDTAIAVLGASLAADCPLDDSVELANLAAGIAVGKLGTASVSCAELQQAVGQQTSAQGYLNEADLLKAVANAREKGEKIVMTNGCFDILHTGHVHYLAQAKALGDRLLVAVNTDESVKRIKGESRPANTLASRAAVLAALREVDWVVAFSEDTPTRIIEAIAPDVLVKGGDNDVAKIPGAAEVLARGGEVLTLDYIEGVSTTKTINRIQSAQVKPQAETQTEETEKHSQLPLF